MGSHQNTLQSRRRFLAKAPLVTLLATAPRFVYAAGGTKKIGFIDVNLDNFHSYTYLRILRNELKDSGFVVAGATAVQADGGRAWADKNNVAWFDSVDALAKNVDVFAILAPSNPETHLDLAKEALPLGKPTFIDKTFAPNTQVAKEIFALADKYGTPVQTSSALRYTPIQQYTAKIGRNSLRHVTAFAPGGNFNEYIVHPVELVISCMGPEVLRLFRPHEHQILLDFSGQRTATINLYLKTQTPYAAMITSDASSEYIAVDPSRLFVDAATAMIKFFKNGKNDIDRTETLAIMRVIDAAKLPEARKGYFDLK